MKYLLSIVMLVVCGENSYGGICPCPWWKRNSEKNNNSSQISHKKDNELILSEEIEKIGSPVTEEEVNDVLQKSSFIAGRLECNGINKGNSYVRIVGRKPGFPMYALKDNIIRTDPIERVTHVYIKENNWREWRNIISESSEGKMISLPTGNYTIYYIFKKDIQDMSYMFYECENLISLDLSKFNTENVKDMSSMFYGCSNLEELNLSGLNNKKIKDMNYLLDGCLKLRNLNLEGFKTEGVFYMRWMFHNCCQLTDLNLSSFITENVRDMSHMFDGCSSLIKLDLSNFKTPNVEDMSYMFYDCRELKSLDISNFTFKKHKKYDEIYFDFISSCENLIEIKYKPKEENLPFSLKQKLEKIRQSRNK